MGSTSEQYHQVIAECRDLFEKKNTDYGQSWTILRPSSLTDQIMIKAMRIRSLEEKKVSKVGEGIYGEFQGIINYCLMALMLLKDKSVYPDNQADVGKLMENYTLATESCFSVMEAKNHDYGEAWRKMRISSFTDLILMKLFRLKQIEDNEGRTLVSEGPEGSYTDILNYAVFALIKLKFEV
jgi:hypothetical protein